VSSSAIISKILHETGTNQKRAGQLAMGVAVIEDVVAVVMLTILNSMVQMGQSEGARVPETLLMLGAFVVLASVVGLLLVPWLLTRMSISAEEELQTLGLAGLMFIGRKLDLQGDRIREGFSDEREGAHVTGNVNLWRRNSGER
jgi:CPA2 family monovalent cation:H+ antiporter-2